MTKSSIWSATVVVVALGLVGCTGSSSGPVLHAVKGAVKLDAEPLETGEIIIRDLDGKRSDGASIVHGEYTLRTTAGRKVVEITAYRDVPGKFREENPGEKVAVREQIVPAKYNAQTSLSAEVPTEALNFELTRK